ncbi:MAG: type II toxin-antitoxin system YafQ family toxin [Firmicutes bacterium]|nr:type II toxin-antitoxin system YafQ family toxin [Bacillota bacterium]
MYKIKYTTAFKKGYKRMKKRGADLTLLNNVISKLRQREKLDGKYKDHALEGTLSGFRECHIQPNWLLVYLIENDILTLTLINTGTHADLFNN